MRKEQRDHEDDWGRWWAVALGRHLKAQVQSSRPPQDPPDFDFAVASPDGTRTTTWGELTGAYYDADEAKWLWGRSIRPQQGVAYVEPDDTVAFEARTLVEQKRQKYSTLVQQRCKGHLLVLLHSRLTTRSTRMAAESSMLAALASPVHGHPDPFDTVWLGYRLPITLESEQEDVNHVFPDATGGDRLNFFKCIWTTSSP